MEGFMHYQGSDLSKVAEIHHIRNRFLYIIKELSLVKGSVLIVGSGDGSLELLLREANPSLEIISLDLNEEFHERISKVSDEVIIGDFLNIEFNRTFDYLVSVDVIEHIIDTDNFLIKARKILSDEGSFFLQTPNLASWHGRLCLLLGYMPEALEVSTIKSYFGKFSIFRHDRAIQHVHVFTYHALREMCGYYGFDIVRAVGVDHRVPALFRRFPDISGAVCLKMRKQI
jgi:2-polyprenyl-3-methyl-5-hydroxy-6-metoxy-1,4-benzoquinol methylase